MLQNNNDTFALKIKKIRDELSDSQQQKQQLLLQHNQRMEEDNETIKDLRCDNYDLNQKIHKLEDYIKILKEKNENFYNENFKKILSSFDTKKPKKKKNKNPNNKPSNNNSDKLENLHSHIVNLEKALENNKKKTETFSQENIQLEDTIQYLQKTNQELQDTTNKQIEELRKEHNVEITNLKKELETIKQQLLESEKQTKIATYNLEQNIKKNNEKEKFQSSIILLNEELNKQNKELESKIQKLTKENKTLPNKKEIKILKGEKSIIVKAHSDVIEGHTTGNNSVIRLQGAEEFIEMMNKLMEENKKLQEENKILYGKENSQVDAVRFLTVMTNSWQNLINEQNNTIERLKFDLNNAYHTINSLQNKDNYPQNTTNQEQEKN